MLHLDHSVQEGYQIPMMPKQPLNISYTQKDQGSSLHPLTDYKYHHKNYIPLWDLRRKYKIFKEVQGLISFLNISQKP